MSAGEPLNPEVIMAWKSSTSLTIHDGYGQTESTLMVGNLPGSDVKLGSMGKPLSPYDVRIVDEGGTELPEREGNIAISLQPKPTGLFVEYIASAPTTRGWRWPSVEGSTIQGTGPTRIVKGVYGSSDGPTMSSRPPITG